jgi:hypothetical protein
MTEERLSRLQKWILKTLYLVVPNGSMRIEDLKTTSLYGLEIWNKEDIESPWRSKQSKRGSMAASMSRTIRALERKNLVFLYGNFIRGPMQEVRGVNIFECVGNAKSIALTDEGEAKAKELLNVNNGEINNKE